MSCSILKQLITKATGYLVNDHLSLSISLWSIFISSVLNKSTFNQLRGLS